MSSRSSAQDPAAARRVLGVDAHAGPTDIRRAYRRLMREHHPDVAPGRADAAARAAEVAAAYAVLTRPTPIEPATSSAPGSPASVRVPPADPPPTAEAHADGVLAIGAPAGEAFLRLLDALETIGEVTYRDRANGDLQALLDLGGHRVELVVALEPRSLDTLALVGVDAHDPGVEVDVDAVLTDLARRIRTGWSHDA